ncbi:MAG TPA: GIY-YIG nuclease family protein [Candidatus Magasanikbacteria bacterium]|nr:GIY-YIG nuclease family protein [Candidatus Magasanikbacteria bacterium]
MPKFTNSKKFNKTNIKDIPENKPIVYRLLNNSNNELYTGIAKRNRTQDRLLEHLNIQKEKISGATKLKIAQVNNLESAKKIEKKLIKQLQPKFNIKDK